MVLILYPLPRLLDVARLAPRHEETHLCLADDGVDAARHERCRLHVLLRRPRSLNTRKLTGGSL